MKDYEEKVLNIMEIAKDNIRTQLDKAYKSGYEDAKSELGQNAIDLAHEESDRAYQQGLNKNVGGYLYKMLQNIWEVIKKIAEYVDNIVFKFTAQEAIAKIKDYEKQQKQDAKWAERNE